MSQSKNPAEQLAREIAREAGFLPDRWRVWLYGELQKDFEAADLEQHRINQLHERMNQAVEALKRVAQHLQLSDLEALTSLTMRQFDAAPESVREGWTARQVTRAIRESWKLAKGVAFGDEQLPVMSQRHWERKKNLTRKRREAGFSLAAIQAWLESEPEALTKRAYDEWADKQNQQRTNEQKPLPKYHGIWRRWRMPWPEIIRAVEEGKVPGQPDEDEAASPRPIQASPTASNSAPLNVGLQECAQRLRSAREAQGWTIQQVADRAGLDRSTIGKFESGQIRSPSFQTIAQVAHAVGLSLDELIADDPAKAKPASA